MIIESRKISDMDNIPSSSINGSEYILVQQGPTTSNIKVDDLEGYLSGQFGPSTIIDIDSTFSGSSDIKVPSQKAVKTALNLKANVADVAGKANLAGGNAFTGTQTFDGRQAFEITKAANFTSVAGESYVTTASATVTDPAGPVNGQSYTVRVSAGTLTIGSDAYSTVGTVVTRIYDGAAWSSIVTPDAFDADEKLKAANLPDEIDARISVLGGTTGGLQEAELGENELAVDETKKRVVYGDGTGGVIDPLLGIANSTLTFIADASNNVKGYGLLTIPDNWRNNASTLKGLSIGAGVTSIGSGAFNYCSGFTGPLTIPNSVTSIGNYAFGFCSGFTGSLTLGNSVTSIGNYAFNYCAGFTGPLTIPNSVTSIGSSAFNYCSGFTSLTIPNSVTSIGSYAFSNCNGFTGSLTIPNSVTTIGSYAFNYCTGFTGSLTIPNLVTSIGNYAFNYCSGFTSLTIPNSVTTIGNGAFNDCSGFTSLTIPNSVTSIGIAAFDSCYGFTGSLTIPNSVTSIGSYAFLYCTGFTGSLTIPNSVTSIGEGAFGYCSGITNAQCRVTKTIIDGSNCFQGTGITTINARASDGTWTAGAGQTIGDKTGITVIKDLV